MEKKEIQLFNQYLQTPYAQKHYAHNSAEAMSAADRLFYMIFDQSFRHYVSIVLDNGRDDQQQWQQDHRALAEIKSEITTYAWGVLPNFGKTSAMMSYLFVHGGWGHLLGNMAFLLLFGFGIEHLYGRQKFLLIYFTTGLFGGLLFTLLDGKPYAPLVGASGAISGLMGAYAIYYGRQRIRFLVWIGGYFNYFRLPALLVLLYWIIKESWQQWSDTQSNVAYLAHLGGLVTGAVLGKLLKKPVSTPALRQQKTAQKEAHSKQFQQEYLRALEHIRRLDFDKARYHLEKILDKNPKHFNALEQLYYIDKLKPAAANYKQTVNQILALDPANPEYDHFIVTVAGQAFPQHMTHKDLTVDAIFSYCLRLLRIDKQKTVDPLIEIVKQQYAENPQLPNLLYYWGVSLAKHGQSKRAKTELVYLSNYYAETEFGRLAKQQLDQWK